MEWYERNKHRLALELGLLRRHHRDARILIDQNRLVVFKKIYHRRTYLVKMTYPRNFPYAQPKVFVVKPSVRTHHQWKDDSLCLFKPNQVGPKTSGKVILDWTIKFLKEYEEGRTG